jgi:hypothetical protein
MRLDPVAELQQALAAHIGKGNVGDPKLSFDKPLRAGIGWSPHLFERTAKRAWYCLSERPETGSWADRMRSAQTRWPALRLGVCAPQNVMFDEAVLDVVDELSAAAATVSADGTDDAVTVTPTAGDLIYEAGLKLSHQYAARVLDRWLKRCYDATGNDTKGVTLEVLTAMLLSQVDGFEVTSRGVSNRSQQIDVQVHNRRVTGILGSSEIVLAEAKNWRNPVGTVEYYSVYRKIETRFGRSRLGVFVTTDRFTEGVAAERLRDSKGNILVVPLDKDQLPSIWRKGTSITLNLEKAALVAASA